jgi:hypothetical protein
VQVSPAQSRHSLELPHCPSLRPPPRPEFPAIPRVAQPFESPWGRYPTPHSRSRIVGFRCESGESGRAGGRLARRLLALLASGAVPPRSRRMRRCRDRNWVASYVMPGASRAGSGVVRGSASPAGNSSIGATSTIRPLRLARAAAPCRASEPHPAALAPRELATRSCGHWVAHPIAAAGMALRRFRTHDSRSA